VRDELNEGDQILVKVLALEGNKIKLSRKAVLREQREKLKGGASGSSAEGDPEIVVKDNGGDRPERSERGDRGDRPRGDRRRR
jgi:polyribonucleotide nucleotidyltransferase